MVAKKRRGQPAPAPKRPISRRLEQVRAAKRVETLLDFHERLTEDSGLEVSYSGVRNYHYDRDPPISYLERVAEVFKVRLAWLVTGERYMTDLEDFMQEEDAPRDITELLLQHSPNRSQPSKALRAQWEQSLMEALYARRLLAIRQGDNPPGEHQVSEDLSQMIFAPLRYWKPDIMTERRYEQYVAAMLHAITLAIPDDRTLRQGEVEFQDLLE